MVGIQSATADNRRGEKDCKKEEEEETTGRKYNVAYTTQGGHLKLTL